MGGSQILEALFAIAIETEFGTLWIKIGEKNEMSCKYTNNKIILKKESMH